MCGIAGALLRDRERALRAVEAMCAQMVARGPDDGGVEAAGPVVLGNRRLAIVDPSPAGHQPMSDPGRGTTLVFNGMIYNFRELRRELEAAGERFASGCDTEVLLRAYGRWGRGCVERLRGMFAFAVWDARSGELVLARDRLGIKPLYYARPGGDGFAFASQVKALHAAALVEPRLDPEALAGYLAFGAVPDPLTALAGVRSLPAAHTATLRADGTLRAERFWELPEADEAAALPRAEAARELERLLRESVRLHLVADAPLGLFLSGGLDSTVLAALAAQEGGELRTVSVAFAEAEFDEAGAARLVARRIGSRHAEVALGADDLLAGAAGAFAAMDQPTMDGLNTHVVSGAAAAAGLKVAVSGLGGDELLDGYGHLSRIRRLERVRRLPPALTRLAAPRVRNEKAAAWLAGELPRGGSYELLRRVLAPADAAGLCGAEPRAPAPLPRRGDLWNALSRADLGWYTRDTLLRDTDALGMAHSLEVRVPFLDHVLVEWALRLPERSKAGPRKALLREACGHLLPPEILARPKQGFQLPIPAWLRGPLREEVAEALRRPPAALAEHVDAAATARIWERFDATGGRWTPVWALYALARWVEALEREPVAA